MENEQMTNREFNLNLYLDYIHKKYPDIWNEMDEHFDGLPGYSNADAEDVE